MADPDWLTESFEANRSRLRAVAFRMLGSSAEADDAVQEAWLRLRGVNPGEVENLGAWLTTVVARISLNMLRSRRTRREDPLDDALGPAEQSRDPGGPEDEALLADSVGAALQVVLDTLAPAERLAFVLHDLFGVPFDEIAPILGRSPTAARQLASRARRRVQGHQADGAPSHHPARPIVDAFLAAARGGDLGALAALLAPDVVLRADGAASGTGVPRILRGADAVTRGATSFPARARWARPALVEGKPGLVLDPGGKLLGALTFEIQGGLITAVEIIGDPQRLASLAIGDL